MPHVISLLTEDDSLSPHFSKCWRSYLEVNLQELLLTTLLQTGLSKSNGSINILSPQSTSRLTSRDGNPTGRAYGHSCYDAIWSGLQRSWVSYWINTLPSWVICYPNYHSHQFGPEQLCGQTLKENEWVTSLPHQSSAELYTFTQRSFVLYAWFCMRWHCQGFSETSLPEPHLSHYQKVFHPRFKWEV